MKFLRWIGNVLRRMVRGIIMFLGVMCLLSIATGVFLGLRMEGAAKSLPKKFVISMTIEDGFVEHENFISPYDWGRKPFVISQVVDALDHAGTDPRVAGLVVRLAGGDMTLSQVYELAQAVQKFRSGEGDNKKFAYIYASSYGSPGGGMGTYFLASAFDEIWLQPMGDVSFAGIRAEMPFARAALEKIGVAPEFFARKEYKSVFETMTAKEMSRENRQAMESLIRDLADSFVYGIAEHKKVDKAQIQALMDKGMFLDVEAFQHGLVTRIADFDTLRTELAAKLSRDPGEDRYFVEIDRYAGSVMADTEQDDADVAIIHVSGVIATQEEIGPSGEMPGSEVTVAEHAVEDIKEAVAMPSVKTIIVRIDSPGGSPVGSEAIRLALLRAKEKGKKIYVSMASTAASGGYWVATGADRIYALPVTITGSIGVAGGKFDLQKMWEKIGIKWDGVQVGENAGMWSLNRPFNASGTERINAMMDYIYNMFVTRVATARKLDIEDAEMIARGRVWTGRQARANGLVDDLGGLSDVLDYTAKDLGFKTRHDMTVAVLPRPETPLERLMLLVEGQAGVADTIRTLQGSVRALTGLNVYEPVSVH